MIKRIISDAIISYKNPEALYAVVCDCGCKKFYIGFDYASRALMTCCVCKKWRLIVGNSELKTDDRCEIVKI